MVSEGFEQSAADPCVFIRKVNDQLAIVAVHVDGLILLTETEQGMIELKASLAARFKMKDKGKPHYSWSKHQNNGWCFADESRVVYQQDITQVQVTRLQTCIDADGCECEIGKR